jgi:hypothetical protein
MVCVRLRRRRRLARRYDPFVNRTSTRKLTVESSPRCPSRVTFHDRPEALRQTAINQRGTEPHADSRDPVWRRGRAASDVGIMRTLLDDEVQAGRGSGLKARAVAPRLTNVVGRAWSWNGNELGAVPPASAS